MKDRFKSTCDLLNEMHAVVDLVDVEPDAAALITV